MMSRLARFIRPYWRRLLRRVGIITVADVGDGLIEGLAALRQEVDSMSEHQKEQDTEIDSAKKRLQQQEITLKALKAQVGVTVPRTYRQQGEPANGHGKHS